MYMMLNDIHQPCCHLVKTPPHDIPLNFYPHVSINTQIITTVHMKLHWQYWKWDITIWRYMSQNYSYNDLWNINDFIQVWLKCIVNCNYM